MTKTAVVALGGNALTRVGQSGTYDEMLANAAAMASAVNDVIETGWRAVIVHGNGPQVGNLALQQEATAIVPAQPLALLNAMTQGLLGSLIARAIDQLRGPGTAAALITHVTVDPADPAFGAPSKPIGPFFDPAEARRLADARGWVVQPDSGRGYRRVVASPEPARVIEIDALRALVDAGHLVIAAGGGGIPMLDAGSRGTHVDAVGSFRPATRELDTITIRKSRVVVDTYEGAWEEAGDVLIPLRAGAITRRHVKAELAELLTGAKPGRSAPREITVFKSVGFAPEDAATARLAYDRAVAAGLGTLVSL